MISRVWEAIEDEEIAWENMSHFVLNVRRGKRFDQNASANFILYFLFMF